MKVKQEPKAEVTTKKVKEIATPADKSSKKHKHDSHEEAEQDSSKKKKKKHHVIT